MLYRDSRFIWDHTLEKYRHIYENIRKYYIVYTTLHILYYSKEKGYFSNDTSISFYLLSYHSENNKIERYICFLVSPNGKHPIFFKNKALAYVKLFSFLYSHRLTDQSRDRTQQRVYDVRNQKISNEEKINQSRFNYVSDYSNLIY